MVLSYCEQCGTFIRADQILSKANEPLICSDCAAGVRRPPQRFRDSDRIPNPFRKTFRHVADTKRS